MKKKLMILMTILTAVLLAACGGGDGKEKKESKGKSKAIEASIKNASFIIANDQEYDPDGETGLIKLDIQMKNKTKETIHILPESQMYLEDDGEQIDPDRSHDAVLELGGTSGKLGAEKQKTFSVLFNVDRDKTYELTIEPTIAMPGEKDTSLTMKVDMSEYKDSYEELKQPVDVVEAYIETIFLDEDRSEELEKMMDVDIEERKKEANKAFADFLKKATMADVPKRQMSKYYKTFQETQKEIGEYDVKLVGNSGERAQLKVDYAGISQREVGDDYRKVRTNFLEKSKTYDRKAADEYALSKLDGIIKKTEPVEGRNEIDIVMVKKDDKWSFEKRHGDSAEKLAQIFAEGRIY